VPTIMREMRWDRIGLLKVDIEGHESVLFARECSWLHAVDAMCIEWHDESNESNLKMLANEFDFLPPQRMPGVWLLRRSP
jgi:hypothetical protein